MIEERAAPRVSDPFVARTIAAVRPLDASAAAEMQATLDRKTKPRRSLGRLEEVCCRIAASRGTAAPETLSKAVVLVAADHGVAEEGVSAYPSEVTAQMLSAFVSGSAAISVLARHAGARLVVVDAGVREPFVDPAVLSLRIGAGTRSFVDGPAMADDDAFGGIRNGIQLAEELSASGIGIVALGDMGIGNTTSAAALTAALLSRAAEEVCGRGTGVDDDGLRRKVGTVRRALVTNAVDRTDPLGVLAAFGGFEIATLVGVILGAAASGLVVVTDGVITTAAALVAARLAPDAAGRMIAAHRSSEPAHALQLEALALRPLLELDMRLGEASGAALALPMIDAALAIAREMGTFEEAGVSDAGA
ncbi:MAG: nicotinate-nucleotide--dimethylbenzimidazole phosphoribosyltransferase [Actinomycetota bacterium]